MHNILIVDSHTFIRSALKMLLEKDGYRVVGEAETGADAIKRAEELSPDLIILDILLEDMDGLKTIERLNKNQQKLKFLIFSSNEPRYFSPRAMRMGASGYVCKSEPFSELIKAIKAIASGYTFFPESASVSPCFRERINDEAALIDSLSNREIFILKKLASGYSNQELSRRLCLSPKTISTYKSRISLKLNLKSIIHMAEFAKRNGLL